MARIRKFVSYRSMERPYTRVSKFKKKSFVKSGAPRKIVRFDFGEANRKFEYSLDLIPKSSIQIRQEAIEAARQTSNRLLEKNLGKAGFHFKIRVYPYHVLRENPLAAGAGADRMSTGMAHSFGKPIGIAAQVKAGQKMFTLSVEKPHIEIAKKALQRAARKMPCSFSIQVTQNKTV
jgi:large subunit ribosomal protein L10e